jgi:hypothetical protein
VNASEARTFRVETPAQGVGDRPAARLQYLLLGGAGVHYIHGVWRFQGLALAVSR